MQGWEHAVVSLVTQGHPHFDLHKTKDAAYQTLGRNHRTLEDHDYYLAFDFGVWSLENSFPDWFGEAVRLHGNAKGAAAAEALMVDREHDVMDRISDGDTAISRTRRRVFLAWLALSEEALERFAEVDVRRGRIRRVIDGREIWEETPELKREYRRLRAYVEAVVRNDSPLRTLLEENNEAFYVALRSRKPRSGQV